MRRIALVALLLGACIEPNLIHCPDGTACSPTQVCSPRGGCTDADQVEQCVAPPVSGDCTLTSGDVGACVDGVCTPRGCGNALVEDGEACDDGNRIGGDGCSATCVSTEACGNGYLDSGRGEACDCGDASATDRPAHCAGFPNSDDPDAPCTPTCLLRGCGDGERAGLEDCDGTDVPLTSCADVGFYGGTLGCLATCRYDTSGCTGKCGDGVRNGPLDGAEELCDGADLDDADCTDFGFYFPSGLACNAVCGFDVSACAGRCGDDIFDDGYEACDPVESSTDLSARALDCTDFGFYAPAGLACDSSCQIDTSSCGGGFCGDGIRQLNEACDGNDLAGTTCSAFGYYSPNTLACRDNCTFDVSGCSGGRCGDTTINGTEQCDGSIPAGTDCLDFGYYAASGLACIGCRFDTNACTGGHCGDGVHDAPEQCDTTVPSGTDCTNFGFYAAPGLACSSACTFNAAGCSGGSCGDNTINGPEVCDGNMLGGASCLTFGFYAPDGLACTSACGHDTSDCRDICGDDKVNGPEACDGAPAPNPSCALVGWDAGQLGCSGTCGDTFARCRRFGVEREVATGAGWTDVFGIDGDALAVGAMVARRQPNGTWSTVAHPSFYPLRGAWGTSMNNVFVVGLSTNNTWSIEHFNGSAFTAMTGPAIPPVDLHDIWGTSSNDVWAVGANATVLRYTAGAWTKVSTPIPPTTLTAVWAFGGHAFVGGPNGTVYHWNGSAWLTETLPDAGFNGVNAISGRALDDIYATTGTGDIYRFNGTAWVSTGQCNTQNLTYDVHANPAGVFIAGLGTTPFKGSLCQYAAGAWHTIDKNDLTNLEAVHGSGSAIYAVGSTTVATTSGANVVDLPPLGTLPPQEFMGLWGSSTTAMFIAGGDPIGNTGTLHSIVGVWGLPLIPDGTKFLRAVHGYSVGSKPYAIAVGNGGTIIGGPPNGFGAWAPHTSNTSSDLHGVWGDAAHVHAVGASGTLLRVTAGGGTWSALTPVTPNTLYSISGIPAGPVFAVGDAGTILHNPGGTTGAWTPMQSNTTVTLYRVWARTASDVYAVGAAGTVMHFNGATWSRIPYANDTDVLTNVWGTTGDLFVTTQQGLKQLVGNRWLDVRMTVPGLTAYIAWGLSDFSLVIGRSSAGAHEMFGLAGRIFRPDASETVCDDFWDDDSDGLADCADPKCATSLACDAASNGGACQPLVEVACGATLTNQTTVEGASRWPYYGTGCSSRDERGREAFYRVRRATPGPINVSVTGANADLDLVVSTMSPTGACTPDLGCITSDQTASMSPSVSFAAQANTDYIVIVDGYQTATSHFTLAVSCP